ncbi:putative esterase [Gordonia polyisoprenivorans VH2]|uniref:Putative esterase n=1 Tax=Gordonia polyisoprenivorans (strain DSM 44266 / VH2) TaxID=1112204 RepID=H6MSJ8_GORPV|nr:putative esterase [Gordonia polyisoprenivorans VH2]
MVRGVRAGAKWRRRSGRSVGARALTLVLAAVSVGVLSVIGQGVAQAAPPAQTWWINSCGMPTQSPGGPPNSVKVRAWTRPQNTKTVVLLDGLRATNDLSGWEHNTHIQDLADRGVNVVEPVGGYESFYTNWDTPDNFSRQSYTYEWGCVISRSLVAAMDAHGLRGPSGHYAIMGISMSGSSALITAADDHRDFDAAGSLSGLLNTTAPGVREAIRVAMIFPAIDGGTPAMNVDAMWGPPWSTRWLDNDPLVQIGKMRGLRLFLYTGSGIPGYTATAGAVLTDPALIIEGVPLEVLSSALTHTFDVQAMINGVPVMTDFPVSGMHDWPYWQDAVNNAFARGFFHA